MARKILLADDSVTAQNMGRRILSDAGYEVITVNNGSAALKKIAEIVPDLIVLDVYMPGYGGLEVCQRLKESQATARIPVLLTVGKLEPFKVDEARRVRADAHIVKPFDSTELLAAIIKLEDKIVPLANVAKPGRSSKAGSSAETPRRGRDKSTDPGSETTSGWKKRLGIPRSAAPSNDVKDDVEESQPKTVRTTFQDLSRRGNQQPAEAKLPEAPAVTADTQETRPASENAGAVKPFENFTVERLIAMETKHSEAETHSLSPESAEKESAEKESAAKLEAMLSEAAAQVSSLEAVKLETPATVEPPSSEAITSELPSTPGKEVRTERSPSEAEVMAAVASLSPAGGDSGKDQQALDVCAKSENLNNEGAENGRVTALDAALAAVGAVCGPRWIAEPVPLSDGDSHLILESEMEKTYAAFAAAESAQAVVAAESISDSSENLDVTGPVQNTFVRSFVESQLAPDVAVQESKSIETSEPAASENAAAHADSEPPSQIAVESRDRESVVEVVASSSAESLDAKPESVEVATAEADTSTAYREIAYAAAASGSSSAVEARRSEVGAFATEFPVGAPSSVTESGASELSNAAQAVTEIVHLTPETTALNSENQGSESELAAAWQNWRQIRESIAGPQLTSQITDAAAAGFKQIRGEEKSDRQETEAAASNRAAAEASTIAGIVDSVFAELKPKLMQEIARKLAEDRK